MFVLVILIQFNPLLHPCELHSCGNTSLCGCAVYVFLWNVFYSLIIICEESSPKARGIKLTLLSLTSSHSCVKCSILFPYKKIIHFFFQRITTWPSLCYSRISSTLQWVSSRIHLVVSPLAGSGPTPEFPARRSLRVSANFIKNGMTIDVIPRFGFLLTFTVFLKKRGTRFYRKSKSIVILSQNLFSTSIWTM